MVQRWSFKEDYIVCKFAYRHMRDAVSQRELSDLTRTLKEISSITRSESVLRKRVQAYQWLFAGADSPYQTKQVESIADAFIKRLENPEYYQKLASYIEKASLDISDDIIEEDYLNFLEKPGLSNLMTLEEEAPSFKDVLVGFIERSGMKDSQVYTAARVSRDKFNHIFNGRKGKKVAAESNENRIGVSRRTIIQLCLGLQLSYEDALVLMRSAGLTFRGNDLTERVVVAFLKMGDYTLDDVNEELDDRGLQAFSESRYDAS